MPAGAFGLECRAATSTRTMWIPQRAGRPPLRQGPHGLPCAAFCPALPHLVFSEAECSSAVHALPLFPSDFKRHGRAARSSAFARSIWGRNWGRRSPAAAAMLNYQMLSRVVWRTSAYHGGGEPFATPHEAGGSLFYSGSHRLSQRPSAGWVTLSDTFSAYPRHACARTRARTGKTGFGVTTCHPPFE